MFMAPKKLVSNSFFMSSALNDCEI
jgi:hypothetical protein